MGKLYWKCKTENGFATFTKKGVSRRLCIIPHSWICHLKLNIPFIRTRVINHLMIIVSIFIWHCNWDIMLAGELPGSLFTVRQYVEDSFAAGAAYFSILSSCAACIHVWLWCGKYDLRGLLQLLDHCLKRFLPEHGGLPISQFRKKMGWERKDTLKCSSGMREVKFNYWNSTRDSRCFSAYGPTFFKNKPSSRTLWWLKILFRNPILKGKMGLQFLTGIEQLTVMLDRTRNGIVHITNDNMLCNVQ